MKLVRSSDSGTVPGIAAVGEAIDRRTFLKRSGVALGAGAAASMFAPQLMRKAKAAEGCLSPMEGCEHRDSPQRVYALLSRLWSCSRSAERSLDRSGTGL